MLCVCSNKSLQLISQVIYRLILWSFYSLSWTETNGRKCLTQWLVYYETEKANVIDDGFHRMHCELYGVCFLLIIKMCLSCELFWPDYINQLSSIRLQNKYFFTLCIYEKLSFDRFAYYYFRIINEVLILSLRSCQSCWRCRWTHSIDSNGNE